MLEINQALISKGNSDLKDAKVTDLQNGCVILEDKDGTELALSYQDVYKYYFT